MTESLWQVGVCRSYSPSPTAKSIAITGAEAAYRPLQGWICVDGEWCVDTDSPQQIPQGWNADPPARVGEEGELDFTLAYGPGEQVDVVVPLSRGSSWQDNELRYALRSMERNLAGLRTVWIVGRPPDWTTGIRNLNAEDRHRTKDANIIEKLRLVCEEPDLSARFLFWSDDQVLLQPAGVRDFGPFFSGRADHFPGDNLNRWQGRLKETGHVLAAMRLPASNYELHVPTPFTKQAFREVTERFDYTAGDGLCVCTLYHNAARSPGRQLGSERAKVESPYTAEALRSLIRSRRFLGYSDAGLNQALRDLLAELFPERSRFEQ